MKRHLALSAAFALATAVTAVAQVDGPPGLIDYQGQLLNSSGGPLTSAGGPGTTGTAANFEIRFRIWNQQSGGALIWAEKQIVTVTGEGFFSVRLGEGEAITVADGDPSPLSGAAAVSNGAGALLGAFDGDERFLGVTVMNPPAVPGEIQPRLAFLAAPFAVIAEHARVAEFGPTSGAFEADQIEVDNLGIGTDSPRVSLHVFGSTDASLADGSGELMIGDQDGTNLLFDNNEILARTNGSPTTLYLNATGGDIQLGKASGATDQITLYGDVGFNTTNPQARIHVYKSGTSGAVIDPEADILVEQTENAFLQLNTFWQREAGILFGRPGGSRHGGILYNDVVGSRGLAFRAGNEVRMTLRDSTGDLGIGTTGPSADLHVVRPDNDVARVYATGSSQGSGLFYAGQSTTYGGGFLYNGDSTPNLVGDDDRTVFFRRNNGADSEVFSYGISNNTVNFAGEVEIGSTTSGQQFNVNFGGWSNVTATIQARDSDTRTFIAQFPNGNFIRHIDYGFEVNHGNAYKPGGGEWGSYSDVRLKKDIQDIDGALGQILKLRPVTFEYSSPERDGQPTGSQIGFVAQEVEEVFPEWVEEIPLPKADPSADSELYKTVNIKGFSALTVAAFRELREEKDQQLAERDAKIASLEERLAKLEALVAASIEDAPPAAE